MVSIHAAPIAASQFFQGLFCQLETCEAPWQTPAPLAATTQRAAENLLDIVRTLCAPDSGWPADKPRIPETLLPYVADEAEELLEALHHQTTAQSAPASDPTVRHPQDRQSPGLELFANLSTRLLWAIAASTPAAMKLLEGVSVRLAHHPEAYGVRLVPVLELHLDQADYALDLATQTHFEPAMTLADEAVLQLPESTAPPLSLAQWRTAIWQQLLAIAPQLQQWQQGTTLQVWLPGSEWTPATAKLGLKFLPMTRSFALAQTIDELDWNDQANDDTAPVGMPSARVWTAEPPEFAALDTEILVPGSATLAQRFSLEADVTFQAETALQQAVATAEADQMRPQLNPIAASPDQLNALDLVRAVFQVIHMDPPLLSGWGRSPLSLTELCHQLKWLWIRASQNLMPLMSGLPARHLQLGHPWESGTVVTLGQLVIQQGGTTQATLDVSTGEWLIEQPTLQSSDVLHLQSATDLPQELWRVSDLTAFLNAQVQQRSPVLAYLMQAVPVQLTSPHDALFPDVAESNLSLRFQVLVDFLS